MTAPLELTPEQAAQVRMMQGFHDFAESCINFYGANSAIGLLARRIAQRMRLTLIEGLDPDRVEVQQQVAACIDARRARIAALTAK